MKYIYVMENMVNHKKYVGQTSDFKKKMMERKSNATNMKSRSYNYPLSNAIRKHGWNNFKNYIVEEIPDEIGQDYANGREQFFIQYYQSLVSQNGYNITSGGVIYDKSLKTQEVLPIKSIKQDIISGMSYKEISSKWKISKGLISLINNGKQWYEESYHYPLCIKSNSKLQNLNTWVKPLQQELMQGTDSMVDLAKKYNKAYSTVKKINSGSSHRNPEYHYPLTSNRT